MNDAIKDTEKLSRHQIRYRNNPEYFRKHREANREKMREYSREHYLKNKENRNKQQREWIKNNREKANAYRREWCRKKRQELRELKKTNTDPLSVEKKKVAKYPSDLKKYNCYSTSKEYRRLYCKAARARRKNGGRINVSILQFIYERNIKENGTLTCCICKNKIAFGQDSLEHKVPVSRGGTNSLDNLDIACIQCNKMKNSKTMEEYARL